MPDRADEWMESAGCIGLGSPSFDPWFPDIPSGTRPERQEPFWAIGRRICSWCPVQLECKWRALRVLGEGGDVQGMMGGMTPFELRAELAMLGTDLPAHGTRERYRKTKCPCTKCRRANADYKAAHKASLRARTRHIVAGTSRSSPTQPHRQSSKAA